MGTKRRDYTLRNETESKLCYFSPLSIHDDDERCLDAPHFFHFPMNESKTARMVHFLWG